MAQSEQSPPHVTEKSRATPVNSSAGNGHTDGHDDNRSDGKFYYPSPEVVAQANIKDPEAVRKDADLHLEDFWAGRAGELEWYKKWDKVLDDSNKPFYKWFVGGKTNIVLNALDRHVRTWRRNKLALIWEGENGEVKTFSYHALNREVCRFSNVLRSMGINKGDRVTIYMPRIPETVIAMLATAKIGAIHSVVYGGFSVEALHGRIEDSESKVIVTADGGYMNGKIVELKKIVDEALKRTAAPETVIVVRRTGKDVPMENGRDYWYHELMNLAAFSKRRQMHYRRNGRRRSALHLIHFRHNRKTKSDSSYPWRIHGRDLLDAERRFRFEGRG